MQLKIHDRYGHAGEAVEMAEYGNCPLMMRLSKSGKDPHQSIIDAVTGRDEEARTIADGLEPRITTHPAFTEALPHVCGGLVQSVVIALSPLVDDEAGIEAEDGTGLAWQGGEVLAQLPETGAILSSSGTVRVFMEMPKSVCANAAGRTLGEVVELPGIAAERRIALMASADGETFIKLAA